MSLFYKIGYALVCVWLIAVLYGCERYSDSDEARAGLAVLNLAAGLILFPSYFLLVYLVRAVRRRVRR